MITRYEHSRISKIWNEDERFNYLLKVELALLSALEELKIIPKGSYHQFENVKISPERIREIEQVTHHDIIAFCSSITEQVPSEVSRFFHFGVTSSDILDTATSLQIRDSLSIVIEEIHHLLTTLKEIIHKYKSTLAMGRSHGIDAEPMIFSQKFLSIYAEVSRRLNDYEDSIKNELTGKISGAVGNYTVLTPELESLVLSKLQLKVEPVSGQVIPRDHIAKIISHGALLASALERMAVELRLLHHSDVGEVQEGFKAGQKGSSTMPHKKNPISSENISGLSRIIRSHMDISFQNIVLWHERDISHSSTERIYLPDHFGIICYMLNRLSSTISKLEVFEETIENKVKDRFKTQSSDLLHQSILINNVGREEIYKIIQSASFSATSRENFKDLIYQEMSKKNLKLPNIKSVSEFKAHYQKQFELILQRVME